GPWVMVLVGATIVGSMSTSWHGVVNPPRPGTVREWSYAPGQVSLKKGDELGRFLLGSTVVMLFPASQGPQFNPTWQGESLGQRGSAVRLGEVMAR
ncbi:MAG: phosphatidylserine decarboxylase, partial [Paucibacter sp.]|nr:phosphatidylserine decarboxylase [Roseateles sp.]